jgi:translation initiation factor 1
MKDAPRPRRVVYSTRTGRVCPKCGWPESDCRCSSAASGNEPVPARIKVNVSVEKRGSGKLVTRIDGLPRNPAFLGTLARDLKKSFGTGGRAGEDHVEIQGDHREALRTALQRKGWVVKG